MNTGQRLGAAGDALPAMERRTTVRKALVARALAVAAFPSSRRLRTTGQGGRVGVPAALIRELVSELEREWPGIVQKTRDRDDSLRGQQLRASGIR